MHVLERRVRLAQEVESLEDNDAQDDGIVRGDGGDNIAHHSCTSVNNG